MISVLRTIPKDLSRGLEDGRFRKQAETIQIISFYWSVKVLRRVLETWMHLLSLRLQRKTMGSQWCEKPQHCNPNPNPLANQLWSIDFLTSPTPLIIPHGLPAFLESLMPLKNWCSIHARCLKSSLKHSICFSGIFSKFKHKIIAYRSSKVSSRPDCIFEIHQLWQSGFSRVYSNCCCSCSFEAELIKIGQSSHKMYSNNRVNFQGCTKILNSWTKSL